jgi:hypothetical protein
MRTLLTQEERFFLINEVGSEGMLGGAFEDDHATKQPSSSAIFQTQRVRSPISLGEIDQEITHCGNILCSINIIRVIHPPEEHIGAQQRLD